MTRQHMAGIAFVLLLIAVVVMRLVGGDSVLDVCERFEGAMGMAFVAFLFESKPPPAPTATLLLVLGLGLVGCGGSSAETRPTACAITRYACQACEAAQQTYCGGAPVEVLDDGAGGEQ